MDEADRIEKQRAFREEQKKKLDAQAAKTTKPMEPSEGWKFLIGVPKAHYFVNMRSLCGRWGTLGDGGLELGNDDSPDNCKECVKRLKIRQANKN